MKKGSEEKREDALIQEQERTASLQKLKEQWSVQLSRADLDDLNMKEKQKRMKMELI